MPPGDSTLVTARDAEREYPYRPSWSGIVITVALFGSGAIFFGMKASHNDKPLLIKGLIRLEPEAATLFLWTATAFSAAIFILAASQIYRRIVYRQRLVLGPTALKLPASVFSSEETEIPYRDIRDLSVVHSSGQRCVYVTHAGGKRRIAASLLPSTAAFDEICDLLAAHVMKAKAHEVAMPDRSCEPGAGDEVQ